MRPLPIKMTTLALMISSMLSYPALARAGEDTKAPSGPTSTGGERAKETGQFSQAGHSAMMSIGDARLAIFNGDP